MGPWSITFLPHPAEGDGPSKTRLNEIPLTSPRKHPKSLAPLWLGTKVWVRGRTKGWGRKCRLPGQRCPGCLVLSARGLGFLPELREYEAIYFHHKTEALEGSVVRSGFAFGAHSRAGEVGAARPVSREAGYPDSQQHPRRHGGHSGAQGLSCKG